jgi:hypothetical protein
VKITYLNKKKEKKQSKRMILDQQLTLKLRGWRRRETRVWGKKGAAEEEKLIATQV